MEAGNTNVSTTPLTVAEMGTLLSILASEYNSTVPAILHRLDNVSGDLSALHKSMLGDKSVEWGKDEDDLLNKNPELLRRWKGTESAELRKKYTTFKSK